MKLICSSKLFHNLPFEANLPCSSFKWISSFSNILIIKLMLSLSVFVLVFHNTHLKELHFVVIHGSVVGYNTPQNPR